MPRVIFLRKSPLYNINIYGVIHTPIYWTLSWLGTVELGFANDKYLPRKPALLLYPEYFDDKGEPILDKLPMEYEYKGIF